jgi:rhodanese-related sulfurtransferase
MPVAGYTDWPTVMGEFLTTLPTDAGYYSIKADKLNEMLVENPPFIVDVREPAEIESNGYIAGPINIPIRELLKNLDKLPAKDQKIVMTCASGHRGSLGMMALRLLGYTDVVNLNGGINSWLKPQFPVETGAPAAPVAGTAPEVDAARLAALDAYLSNLPEGFGAIKSPDFNTELVAGNIPFILDVRSTEEWDANGHIEGAVSIPVVEVPANLAQLPADKSCPDHGSLCFRPSRRHDTDVSAIPGLYQCPQPERRHERLDRGRTARRQVDRGSPKNTPSMIDNLPARYACGQVS